jgi:hypothetical protein
MFTSFFLAATILSFSSCALTAPDASQLVALAMMDAVLPGGVRYVHLVLSCGDNPFFLLLRLESCVANITSKRTCSRMTGHVG